MATMQYNSSVPVSGTDSTAVSLTGRIMNAVNRVRRYQSLRRAERELMALDSRMLADIGIERDQIHQRVWQGRNGG